MGAIDGILIQIEKPTVVADPAQYWSRDGFYAFSVQAITDSTYRFMQILITCVRSTRFSCICSKELARILEAGFLPALNHLVGDHAYERTNYMFVTVISSRATPGSVEEAYNFNQSSYHIHVQNHSSNLSLRSG